VAARKLLYFVSVDWYFVSHRLPLAVAARDAGYDVTVITHVLQDGAAIRDAGLKLAPVTIGRASLNPLRELQSVAELVGQYRRVAPDLVHNVAVKPVVYGTFAARAAGVKGMVNALMGLGWVFSSDSAKARALRPLVTAALRSSLSGGSMRTIVQNADDAALLAERRLTRAENIRLIRGSGVDPKRYATEPPPAGVPLIVLQARLLIAKGVREFMQAAALLKSEGVAARFALVGKPDSDNVAAVSRAEIERAVAAGDIEYWGWREDMPRVLSEASIVCLPSYGEGLPKALLEAAASARAIVATDVPGCREIVRPGENGWLVPPRDVAALAAALREAIARPDVCARYGGAGRRMVGREFSLDAVIRDTLAVYEELSRSA
jgi:glycosyltransferase involved in cell wall biosynthesis